MTIQEAIELLTKVGTHIGFDNDLRIWQFEKTPWSEEAKTTPEVQRNIARGITEYSKVVARFIFQDVWPTPDQEHAFICCSKEKER